MFQHLHLANFKRFSTDTHLALRKINILVGPNNSGKSSIISAFRIILQTLDSYDEQLGLLLNGPLGDFGTYRDVVYKNHRGRPMQIGFSVEVPTLDRPDSNSSERETIHFDLSYKFDSTNREIYLDDLNIRTDNTPLIHFKYSKETGRHTVERFGSIFVPPSLKATISREFRVRHFVPQPISARLGMFGSERETGPYHEFIQKLRGREEEQVLRRLLRLSRHLMRFVESSDYLGPLRTPPQRTYLFTGERRQRIGTAGENMTTLLVKGSTSKKQSEGEPLISRVNSWLIKSRIAGEIGLEPISDRHYELKVQNFFTKEKQNIADVGYGHSQVLPVLVGGYALKRGASFIVEQPELHLHPKAQSELGDFLFDLYRDGVQTIVETHSEHLILRLQQYVAAGAIDTEDIRIFYIHNDPAVSKIDKESGSSEVLHIDIDRKGKFSREWPHGFFPERLEESRRLAQIRAAQSELPF